jgi:hypothetical protein
VNERPLPHRRRQLVPRARVGHELKSRALRTTRLYSRLSDEGATASYSVGLPNGGDALLRTRTPRFPSGRRYDYRLRAGSPAIGCGSVRGLRPRFEYRKPAALVVRPRVRRVDAGTYECG